MKKITEYKHVVWDWNGTLLDDFWLCIHALNTLLKKENRPSVEPDYYREIFDFPVVKTYEALKFDLKPGDFEKMSNFFFEIYEAKRRECMLQKGARKFIHLLNELKISQSILSAYKHDRLQKIISEHDLDKYFTCLSGNDDILGNDKSYRASAHLKELKIAPENVIYLGDTLHDVETAKAMNVDCVLFDWGEKAHMSRERLLKSGVPVIRSYDELL